MPDGIENKVAYLNGAKIGDLYGSNYIEISNAGVLSFHGTAHIDDESTTIDDFKSIAVGQSGSEEVITVATQRGLQVYTTSALAAGNISSMTVSQELTGASAVNTAEVAQFILSADVQVGNWANAVLAKIDFQTDGKVTGLAGVVCAELDLPGSNTGGAGTYSCFEAEIICPASYEGNSPIHVFQINAQGAAVTEFDDNGYLFDLTGVSSGAGSFWYDNQKAAPAIEEFIRVKTPAGTRFLALYDANT